MFTVVGLFTPECLAIESDKASRYSLARTER
jgi:hypothetical protein